MNCFSNDYGVSYFKQFNIVLNALDNRVARNHVNRMCLAADVPLIETGTAGYAGQVSLSFVDINLRDLRRKVGMVIKVILIKLQVTLTLTYR